MKNFHQEINKKNQLIEVKLEETGYGFYLKGFFNGEEVHCIDISIKENEEYKKFIYIEDNQCNPTNGLERIHNASICMNALEKFAVEQNIYEIRGNVKNGDYVNIDNLEKFYKYNGFTVNRNDQIRNASLKKILNNNPKK